MKRERIFCDEDKDRRSLSANPMCLGVVHIRSLKCLRSKTDRGEMVRILPEKFDAFLQLWHEPKSASEQTAAM